MTEQMRLNHSKHWHAVHTRSRHEKILAGLFAQMGVEHFLPLRRVLSQWADRKKWVQKPMFPGYLFVHIATEDFPTVSRARGAVRLLGPAPDNPSVVPDADVENIRRLIGGVVPVEPCPYNIHPGQSVRITDGPLQGVVGELLHKGRRCFLVVSVKLLGQSVAVEVAADTVRAL